MDSNLPEYEQELEQAYQQVLQRQLKELEEMENNPEQLEQVLQECQEDKLNIKYQISTKEQMSKKKYEVKKEEQSDEKRTQRKEIQILVDRRIIQQHRELGGACKQIAYQIREKDEVPIKSNQVHRRLSNIMMQICRNIEKFVKKHDLVPINEQLPWDNLRLHKHQNTLINLNKLLMNTHELDEYAKDILTDERQQMLSLLDILMINQIPGNLQNKQNEKKQKLDDIEENQIIRLYKFLSLLFIGETIPSSITCHDHSSSENSSDLEMFSNHFVKNEEQSLEEVQDKEDWTEEEEALLCEYTNKSRTTSQSQKYMESKFGTNTKWNSIERINGKVQSIQLKTLNMLKIQASKIYKYVNVNTPQARKTLTFPTVAKMSQTVMYGLMDRMTLSFSEQLLKYYQFQMLKQNNESICTRLLKRTTELIYEKQHFQKNIKGNYKGGSNEYEMLLLEYMEKQVKSRQNKI